MFPVTVTNILFLSHELSFGIQLNRLRPFSSVQVKKHTRKISAARIESLFKAARVFCGASTFCISFSHDGQRREIEFYFLTAIQRSRATTGFLARGQCDSIAELSRVDKRISAKAAGEREVSSLR